MFLFMFIFKDESRDIYFTTRNTESMSHIKDSIIWWHYKFSWTVTSEKCRLFLNNMSIETEIEITSYDVIL